MGRPLRGRLPGYQTATGRIGIGTEGFGSGRHGYGIVHFTTPDEKETSPRFRPNRHLRQNGEIPEASGREALGIGGPATQRRMEEDSGGAPGAPAQRRSRVNP